MTHPHPRSTTPPVTDTLAIIGSKGFANPGGLGTAAAFIAAVLDHQRPDKVLVEAVAGLPEVGVGQLAEQAARQRGIPVEYVSAAVGRFQGRGGVKQRGFQIAMACTRLLWIYCAEHAGRGAAHPYETADHRGKQVQRIPIGAKTGTATR